MFDFYSYIILPILIFFARVTDVSIGTIRIILVAKGYKKLAPVAGFFETLIWIVAISNIIQNIDNWACYIGYAAGFATGNLVGMFIEEKLALGHELIRIITVNNYTDLSAKLHDHGFAVTVTNAEDHNGPVGILYIITTRKRAKEVVDIVNEQDPSAIYTIESIRHVNRDIFFGQEKIKNRKLLLKYK
ncbi:MAG: DUF2179 domain-containing protein [Salinivirgaceae bacterium]|nr:DUF2179 domain-containing protein [Salinivirgaceae bacterium]